MSEHHDTQSAVPPGMVSVRNVILGTVAAAIGTIVTTLVFWVAAALVGGQSKSAEVILRLQNVEQKMGDLATAINANNQQLANLNLKIASEGWTQAKHDAYAVQVQAQTRNLEDRIRTLELATKVLQQVVPVPATQFPAIGANNSVSKTH